MTVKRKEFKALDTDPRHERSAVQEASEFLNRLRPDQIISVSERPDCGSPYWWVIAVWYWGEE